MKSRQKLWKTIASGLALTSTLAVQGLTKPAFAQASGAYCQLSAEAIAQKNTLREQAFNGNAQAKAQYQALLQNHAQALAQCRSRTWPQTQAIWLRLHPCDARPGVLDEVLDTIVNKGYNEVYIEVFYNSQVLLPANDNPTPWPSVVRSPGAENVDLFADALQKARARGLKPYAWLFSMNYGYAYSTRPDRQQVLARNGLGQSSIEVVHDRSQTFIDPYNPQALREYAALVQEVVERKPDGVLFDYIRYPRGTGPASVASNVKDLWIYSPASRQALLNRATNEAGRDLINRYLDQGFITAEDVNAVRSQYNQEPNWEGFSGGTFQGGLWTLAVSHAAQGVISFLEQAAAIPRRNGIPTGAVFFPGGNKPVGAQGFDSRLQPWDRFSSVIEWHPMSYSICGSANCVVDEVQRVIDSAMSQTRIVPALAGFWGRWDNQRPPLETQMQGIRRSQGNRVNAVSHFAYSWQERQSDRDRQFCQL